MLYIFYKPNTEHERDVTEFTRQLDRQKIEYEIIDANSKQGVAKAEIYDITRYPSALAVRGSTGEVLQEWPGILPTVSDAGYFAGQ